MISVEQSATQLLEQYRHVTVVSVVGLDVGVAAAILTSAGASVRIGGNGRVIVTQDPPALAVINRDGEVVVTT